jgi:hypothetical protein
VETLWLSSIATNVALHGASPARALPPLSSHVVSAGAICSHDERGIKRHR